MSKVWTDLSMPTRADRALGSTQAERRPPALLGPQAGLLAAAGLATLIWSAIGLAVWLLVG